VLEFKRPVLFTEILIILLLIVINGLFVLSEMSVVSSRKAASTKWINAGTNVAGTALKLMENPNLFLATVQIGVTLVGVLVGTGWRRLRSLGSLLSASCPCRIFPIRWRW
jgi:CBS domain containing-hemolysin-like protein